MLCITHTIQLDLLSCVLVMTGHSTKRCSVGLCSLHHMLQAQLVLHRTWVKLLHLASQVQQALQTSCINLQCLTGQSSALPTDCCTLVLSAFLSKGLSLAILSVVHIAAPAHHASHAAAVKIAQCKLTALLMDAGSCALVKCGRSHMTWLQAPSNIFML